MKKIIVLVVLAGLAGAGWFLGGPLLIDDTVDESFDYLLADGRLDMAAIEAMPVAELARMQAPIMQAAAAAPSTTVSEDMPESGPMVVKAGEFVDADSVHQGSGTATLYVLANGEHVMRFQDFEVSNGPALVVYLVKHPLPSSAADVTDGGFVSLGKLKGNIGNQNYRVPAEVDIAEYSSVVVWCELFGVLFSPAALRAP